MTIKLKTLWVLLLYHVSAGVANVFVVGEMLPAGKYFAPFLFSLIPIRVLKRNGEIDTGCVAVLYVIHVVLTLGVTNVLFFL